MAATSSLPADSFPLPPRVEWVGPRRGVFRAPFAFISPSLGRIEIEEGFDTDYASVPRALWWLYPPDGPYSPAAWIHDWLYWYQTLNGKPVTRAQADLVFLEAMRALPEVRATQRRVMYRGVRVGGAGPWARAQRERLGSAAPFPPARMKRYFAKLRR